MPQLDYTTYSSQIFWLLLNFAILLFVTSKFILPRLKSIIDERNNNINSNLKQLESLKDEIEQINVKIKNIKEESAAKYKEEIKKALQEAEKHYNTKAEALKISIKEMSEKREEENKAYFQQSMKEAEDYIEKLSKDIKNKILN